MTHNPLPFSLTVFALLALSACASVPPDNQALDSARSDYARARNNPQVASLATPELTQAGEAVNLANAASARFDDPAEVTHLAYVAKQRVALADEVTLQRIAIAATVAANSDRDAIRLAVRTQEADAATGTAVVAVAAAEVARQNTAIAQQQTAVVTQGNQDLQAQLRTLNAKETDRGMVISLGDVLFAINSSELKPNALIGMARLSDFLKHYPDRRALVEGYTDDTGSDSRNQTLSDRRAEAVRSALVQMGVNGSRIDTRGYGDAYPVAENNSAANRQLNRRVEIVLSDASGKIAAR